MTPLEIFAIIVLAGAVIVLFYYYLKEMNRTGSAGFDTLKSSATNMRKRSLRCRQPRFWRNIPTIQQPKR